ncbi:MAG: NUDIX hydrolase [Polyangia bacterium]|jgi:8-oxo-dGTP pyrophosphatase MutT (NUDIX family)
MQVYLALVTSDWKSILIAQKRIVNDLWGGKKAQAPSLVNQAGQFCLPGGGLEKGLTPEQGAVLEFLEETGVDLNAVLSPRGTKVKEFAKGYFCCVFVMLSVNEMQVVFQAARNNIAQGQVKDGELERVILAGFPVARFLGNRVALPVEYDKAIQSAKKYSQDVDWYALIAKDLDQVALAMQKQNQLLAAAKK